MSLFSEEIKEAIQDFKHLYKKHSDDANRYQSLIEALGIKGRELKTDNDATLYLKALKIIDTLEHKFPEEEKSLTEFNFHFKELMGNYCLDREHVFHTRQQAARALLHAIQMASKPIDQLDQKAAKRFEKMTNTIVRWGDDDLIAKLEKTFKVHQSRHRLFFMIQLNHLTTQLRKVKHKR